MDEHACRTVCSAVLSRKRLSFEYRARTTDEKTRRTVSPQRITHYRDNWYLDAWDVEKDALRSFLVDRLSGARQPDAAARDVDDAQLAQHLAGSYSILSGPPKGCAQVGISATAARAVADQPRPSQ